jgi:hypothetical protein
MILSQQGWYSNLYSNQTDPRNKRGGVARLLLNKGILAGNWHKEIGGININI